MARPKLAPFKVLVVILYGDLPAMTWDSGRVRINLKRLSIHLKMRYDYLKTHIEWLEQTGYLQEVSWVRGGCWATPRTPPNLDTEILDKDTVQWSTDNPDKELMH